MHDLVCPIAFRRDRSTPVTDAESEAGLADGQFSLRCFHNDDGGARDRRAACLLPSPRLFVAARVVWEAILRGGDHVRCRPTFALRATPSPSTRTTAPSNRRGTISNNLSGSAAASSNATVRLIISRGAAVRCGEALSNVVAISGRSLGAAWPDQELLNSTRGSLLRARA
jgi:hypothetical protein